MKGYKKLMDFVALVEKAVLAAMQKMPLSFQQMSMSLFR